MNFNDDIKSNFSQTDLDILWADSQIKMTTGSRNKLPGNICAIVPRKWNNIITEIENEFLNKTKAEFGILVFFYIKKTFDNFRYTSRNTIIVRLNITCNESIVTVTYQKTITLDRFL